MIEQTPTKSLVHSQKKKALAHCQSSAQDAHTLDSSFYNELLFIMGLEEGQGTIAGRNKKIIRRLSPEKRCEHSLLESAMRTARKRLAVSCEDDLFEQCLIVVLQWIQRLIFLKFFEAHWISCHADTQSHFLCAQRFGSFQEIDHLFFDVLCVEKGQRSPYLRADFKDLPFLNSNLFHVTDLERQYVRVTEISRGPMPLCAKSICAQTKALTTPIDNLTYLLTFFDCYDFAIRPNRTRDANAKPWMPASVLGLVYEKIKGYRDGSVFTPNFIAEHMSQTTLRKVVWQKLRDKFDCQGDDFEALVHELRKAFQTQRLSRKAVSEAIDSIKVCDPAVGSGHFLVSALNALMCIKSELGVLLDDAGDTLDVRITSHGGALEITDENGAIGTQRSTSARQRQIEKTIWKEKQTIIENCLFGVDIDPEVVRICRLRLWMELIGSASMADDRTLTALPNLELNIRVGNSLIARAAVKAGASIAVGLEPERVRKWVSDYKCAAHAYQRARSSLEKDRLRERIRSLRSQAIAHVPAGVDACTNTALFEAGFEWMVEFPDMLSDEGTFTGFDCLLANPPFMRVQGMAKTMPRAKAFYEVHYQVADGAYDLANLFVERAVQLSAPHATHAFILPHKFLNATNGRALRRFLLNGRMVESIVHFGALQIFQDVSTYTCILTFGLMPSQTIDVTYVDDKDDHAWGLSCKTAHALSYHTLIEASRLYQNDKWILFACKLDEEIFSAIYANACLMKEAVEIFQGIATSKDDLYILENIRPGRYRVPLSGKEYALEADFVKPYVRGKDVHRFERLQATHSIFFPYRVDQQKKCATPVTLKELRDKYPSTYRYVMDHEQAFKQRESAKAARTLGDCWYGYLYPKSLTKYERARLSSMEICTKHPNVTQNDAFYHGTSVYSWLIRPGQHRLSADLLMGIANSKLMWWFLKLTGDTLSSDSRRMTANYLNAFPLPCQPDVKIQARIERAVRKRLASTDAHLAKRLEAQIDAEVCLLYGLDALHTERILASF